MASISFGNSFRVLGRGHLSRVSSRITPSSIPRPEPVLRRGFASIRPQNVLDLSCHSNQSLLRPNYALSGLVFTRSYSKDTPASSTETAASTTTEPEGAASTTASTSPDVPLPEDAASTLSDTASGLTDTASSNLDAIYTQLQYGDLGVLGLTSWTPAGIVRWTLEIINTTTHLPWFWTLVAGATLWRLVVIPVSLRGLRNSSRLQPYQAEIQKLQADMNSAVHKKDPIERQRNALKLKEIYDKAGVNMLGGVVVPLVQIPVSLGVFFGVRGLCNYPVEQLKWSGLEWLPDLTIPDPTWALPLALIALINAQVSLGSAEMDLKTRPNMGHLMNALRVLSVLTIGITASLPAGLVVSLVTATFLTVLQTIALRNQSLRRLLGINNLPESVPLPSIRESVDWAIKGIKRKMEEAKNIEAHKVQRARASQQMKQFEQARKNGSNA
ncbi:Mitochondrial inner membrane protein OXA1L [Leucoagaricus sp. SymC.cos]|nr:Mitochondrial inner membrane protein OXA1L [Leucoagaricus sp. SymC.cos]